MDHGESPLYAEVSHVSNTFLPLFLDTVQIGDKGSQDLEHRRELGHQLRVQERHLDQELHHQLKLEDHRQSEGAFQEVRPTNSEEVLVPESEGIVHHHLVTEEVPGDVTVHQLPVAIATVVHILLNIVMIADRSRQHSATRWNLRLVINPTQP